MLANTPASTLKLQPNVWYNIDMLTVVFKHIIKIFHAMNIPKSPDMKFPNPTNQPHILFYFSSTN